MSKIDVRIFSPDEKGQKIKGILIIVNLDHNLDYKASEKHYNTNLTSTKNSSVRQIRFASSKNSSNPILRRVRRVPKISKHEQCRRLLKAINER